MFRDRSNVVGCPVKNITRNGRKWIVLFICRLLSWNIMWNGRQRPFLNQNGKYAFFGAATTRKKFFMSLFWSPKMHPLIVKMLMSDHIAPLALFWWCNEKKTLFGSFGFATLAEWVNLEGVLHPDAVVFVTHTKEILVLVKETFISCSLAKYPISFILVKFTIWNGDKWSWAWLVRPVGMLTISSGFSEAIDLTNECCFTYNRFRSQPRIDFFWRAISYFTIQRWWCVWPLLHRSVWKKRHKNTDWRSLTKNGRNVPTKYQSIFVSGLAIALCWVFSWRSLLYPINGMRLLDLGFLFPLSSSHTTSTASAYVNHFVEPA